EGSDDSIASVQTTVNQTVDESISTTKDSTTTLSTHKDSTQGKIKKQWKKTTSRKRKIEETDGQLDKSTASLNESIKLQESSMKRADKQEMDEDYMYCMSLGNRMRKLDEKNKAVVRSATEKIFLDIQFGNYNNLTMQNPMQFTTQQPLIQSSSQNLLGNYLWTASNNPFPAQNDQQFA
ncbi:Hypothetical predicted protein, partial [Paramuricea clavata]